MKRIISVFFTLIFFVSIAFPQSSMYRIILKDKGNPDFSINDPIKFLSEKSIERRNRQHLYIDSYDLPIDESYLDAITATGAVIVAKSKWTETVVAETSDPSVVAELKKLSFVDTLYCVRRTTSATPKKDKIDDELQDCELRVSRYGDAFTQISLNNGHLLHDAGFRGSGITIAVIDAGFDGANKVGSIDFSRVKEVKNFNHETSNLLASGVTHGTSVLSCMLANSESVMIGTAPEAEFYLFRSEVADEEFPVEEDYWVAALEYADSIGADIVTSSLGYSIFDDAAMNHTHTQLDGKTIPASRAASLAASRGILLFNSAGNERNKTWRKITIPSDADNIITVASVTADSTLSSFSSVGYSADGRIKPDLAAMGSNVKVATPYAIVNGSGTSYSTPILAGLGACLWQALPTLTASQMLALLRESGNHYLKPDSLTGFGIADVYKAYSSQITSLPTINIKNPENSNIFTFGNTLYINLNISNLDTNRLLIYSMLGNCVLKINKIGNQIDISALPKGIYIAQLQLGDRNFSKKFIKQ